MAAGTRSARGGSESAVSASNDESRRSHSDSRRGVTVSASPESSAWAAMAAAAERDQPAFVLFHAGYCRACIAVVPKFAALARAFGSVSFATVKLEDAGELASRRGVRETPLIHIYDRGNGKVDEFPCGLSSVQRLRDTVQEFAKHSDGFNEEEEHTGTRNM